MGKALTQEEFKQRLFNYTKGTVTLKSPYINRRTKVNIECNICGYIWEIAPASVMYDKKEYDFVGCPKCKYIEMTCAFCGKKFERLKTQVEKSKSGLVFCSKECGNKYKNEQVTNYQNSTDYRRNAFLAYPHKCYVCGYDDDERILEVHHIDENRNNNDISNLKILCPNCHKKLSLHLYTLEELLNK